MKRLKGFYRKAKQCVKEEKEKKEKEKERKSNFLKHFFFSFIYKAELFTVENAILKEIMQKKFCKIIP